MIGKKGIDSGRIAISQNMGGARRFDPVVPASDLVEMFMLWLDDATRNAWKNASEKKEER